MRALFNFYEPREHLLNKFYGVLTWLSNSNFSNTAALLWHAYHSLPFPSSQVNWAGFYFADPTNPSQLLLGPFQGKLISFSLHYYSSISLSSAWVDYYSIGQVACQVIAFGRGVCGTAAQSAKTQLVRDVEKFPGHIACDGASKSEIVVPIVKDEKVREWPRVCGGH